MHGCLPNLPGLAKPDGARAGTLSNIPGLRDRSRSAEVCRLQDPGRPTSCPGARDIFGERLDHVVHMVRQDREELRGWEEPAHLRAVLRRTVREGGSPEAEAVDTAVAPMEFGRAAGEPDRGQQREAMGQLLEA